MKLVFPPLYAIMDAVLLRARRPSASLPSATLGAGRAGGGELAFAELLAQSGVGLIQYRDKQISSRRLFEITRELVSLLSPLGVRSVVNDRADVAALSGAGGVHVGQEDLPVAVARKLCGPSCWVGVSTHTLEQARAAAETSADYIAIGPIFATSTKERPDPVVGPALIREVRPLTRKPLVAIGGITLEGAAEAYRAGADSVAVARDLLCASDPGTRARQYLELAARVLPKG